MQLDDKKWKEFEIYDIFNHIRGKRQIAENRKKGTIPYYSASKHQNGLTDLISNPAFTVNTNAIIYTTFGDAYYVEKGFTCSDEITILTNKSLDKYNGLFLCACINQNRNKYCFGRKAFSNKIGRDKILIPTSENGNPDYEFMSNYIRNEFFKEIEDLKKYCQNALLNINKKDIPKLSEKKWEAFNVNYIFPYIQRGKRLKKGDHKAGNIPYVSSTMMNNGVDNFISNKEGKKFDNCITIANSGSVGASFYHQYEFIGSDHITAFKNEKFNKYIYLFLATIVSRISDKYSFNREINDFRISNEKVLLPVNEDGNPDYEYMEQYIKNIMCNQYKRYLDFLED
ncbi:MAG: restriction endonuclease subunit S [Bacilli bacterium]|nr:restriction endonuclease subunit S [Bacilli bacterium]